METQINDVHCYGKLEEDSNFYVTCEDAWEDGVWTDGNPNTEDFTFKNWTEVVEFFETVFDSKIEEIEAI